MRRGRLLVVDDKANFLALFRRIAPADVDVVCASDGARALELLASETFDVVVTDVRLPGADGLSILRHVREAKLDLEVILTTAYGTIHDAVTAMKLGAAEYLTKPFDPDDASAAITMALARRRARAGASSPPSRLLPPTSLVGESPGMRRVLEAVARAAASDAPVLLTGERGTGKQLAARTIHARSARRDRRFVAVNCGALGDHPEAELFGHVRGALPGSLPGRRGAFEDAAGGTLLLDEIEALPVSAQALVTQALRDRIFRRVGSLSEQAMTARIIGATDTDLARRVDHGTFRLELYERMNVFSIDVPALRDRRQDVPLLVAVLLPKLAASSEAPERTVPIETMSVLLSYDWPGNVRQLETVLARMVASTSEAVLTPDLLPDEVRTGRAPSARPPTALTALPYREALSRQRDRATREYLLALLEDVRGNVTQAAERAGIERESFHRLMKRHGIRAEDYRPK